MMNWEREKCITEKAKNGLFSWNMEGFNQIHNKDVIWTHDMKVLGHLFSLFF